MPPLDTPFVRRHPRVLTAVISVIGYGVVIGAFAGMVPVPPIGNATVQLFSDAIALINATALSCLLGGYWAIKRQRISLHRALMVSAFALILLFLVIYVWKVGGGFEKQFVGPPLVRTAYLAMLAVHILLSVVAVPVVLHAIVLGLSREPSELGQTIHPTIGRIAVLAWSVSLALGVVTYLLLNHIYEWEALHRMGLLFVASIPKSPR